MFDYQSFVPDYLHNSQCYYVCIVDMEGRYLYVNNYFQNKFSFLAENFLGLPFQITVYKEDIEKCNYTSWQCIQHPNMTFNVTVRKPNLEGNFFWTNWEFSLLRDEHNQNIGILCIGNDITAEKILYDVLQNILWQESHLLRKPVANILALVELIAEEGLDNRKLNYLRESAQELDVVFHKIAFESSQWKDQQK